MIQPAGGRKKITVYYYNSFRKSRYLVQKTLVSVDGMGDSDGDDGSSFGSIETVTDSEQEANAAALLTAAARDLSWTFLPGGLHVVCKSYTWIEKLPCWRAGDHVLPIFDFSVLKFNRRWET